MLSQTTWGWGPPGLLQDGGETAEAVGTNGLSTREHFTLPIFTSLVLISGSQHLIVFLFITLCNVIFNLIQVQIKLLLLLLLSWNVFQLAL